MSKTTYSFFEGPEKKVELAVREGQPSLRGFGRARWESIVWAASAKVLSVRSNDQFDAYLLSESSLFVFDDHATMITCGQTRLVDAAAAMLDMVGRDAVAMLVYERKNEHFPAMQHSTFLEDAARLGTLIDGRALRFGLEHANCIEMFVAGLDYQPDAGDVTLEVLMHGLEPDRAAAFRSARSERTASVLGLDNLIGEKRFEIDEYAFEPAGYSLNALCGGSYYTIHVTPELEGSYASFETNWDFRGDPSGVISRVVEAFGPESFDVLAFVPGAEAIECQVSGYLPRKQVRAAVAGYEVSFRSFFRPSGLEQAVPILLR